MKRFEKAFQSAENAGLFMAQTMKCPTCPLDIQCFESTGKPCCEVWANYFNEEVKEN